VFPVIGLAIIGISASAAEPAAAGIEFFERQIRPLLAEACYSCHSAEAKKIKGGLRVDSYAAMLSGGSSKKPALVPGKLDDSALIHAVRWLDEDTAMPPKERLAPEKVKLLEEWVTMGAPHPDAAGIKPRDPAAELAAAKSHWSFQPISLPAVPAVGDGWAVNEIDRFIAAGHAQAGLKPVGDADKRTFIRRATYDLTGLPPTAEEVERFLADESPQAFATVIDRLLASKAYGERWGRHWLDLARYADTEGDSADYPVPQAYRYRNYVIDSFNADKPYDQFLREQIAGDLLPAKDEAHRREMTIGTGFIALSRRFSVNPEADHHLTIEDTIDTTGRVMMGLSLSCARCHDHKFDPIPTSDYYALYGIFASTRYPFPGSEEYKFQHSFVQLVDNAERDRLLGDKKDRVVAIDAEYDALRYEKDNDWKIREEIKKAKAEGREPPKEPRGHTEIRDAMNKLMKERRGLVEELPHEIPTAYAVAEGDPRNERIQKRGERWKLGDEVHRGFLQIAGGQKLPQGSTGSGRLELAGWLTDAKNPLTARVAANRLWHLHFGRGLVPTTNDFGLRGAVPVNQPLLDWLASRLIQDGWSFKSMHRRIMLSHTYRLAATNDPQAAVKDADNARNWRFSRRRLAAEEVRDAMMAVSGTLDRAMPGAHQEFPSLNKKDYSQHHPFQAVYDSPYRSVYVMQQRIRKHPFFEVFDGADTNSAVGERVTTITPLQALFQLNSRFMQEQASALASRLENAGDPLNRIAAAYLLVLSRPASEDEVRAGVDYLRRFEELAKTENVTDAKPLTSFIRALFASNEFMFID
jgi:cytochrome c553